MTEIPETFKSQVYGSRSSAIRSARSHCKKLFGRSYEASEGADFIIHSESTSFSIGRPHSYELRSEILAEARRQMESDRI